MCGAMRCRNYEVFFQIYPEAIRLSELSAKGHRMTKRRFAKLLRRLAKIVQDDPACWEELQRNTRGLLYDYDP